MLERFLAGIDLLGLPVILRFARAKKVRSGFGGFWTLAFLAFVAWAIYNSGKELVNKDNPKSNDGVVYNNEARPVEVSTQNIPLGFTIINDGASTVDMTKIFCQYQVGFTPIGQSTIEYHDLETCTYNHFNGNFYPLEGATPDMFLCIPLSLQSAPVNSFIFNIMCASPFTTEFDAWLAEAPRATLYYPKYGVTLQNYERPVQTYFAINQMVVKAAFQTTSWTLTHLTVTTDNGWITSNEKTDKYIRVTQDEGGLDTPIPNIVQMMYQFTPDREELFYTRSYTKIQNVLADVGGLAGSVLAILLIIVTPYSRVKLSEAFVNEMFDLARENGSKGSNDKKKQSNNGAIKSLRASTKISSEVELRRRNSIGVQDLESPETPTVLAGEGKDEVDMEDQTKRNKQGDLEEQAPIRRREGVFGTIRRTITNTMDPEKTKRPKVISISALEYAASFIYQSESTKIKMNILSEGMKALDNRMDVFNLLKKLRDIDKMKGLVFDKEQQFLFDHLPRPGIGNKGDYWFNEEYLSYHEISERSNDIEQLRILEQIMTAKQKIRNKAQKNEIDEKLLHLL